MENLLFIFFVTLGSLFILYEIIHSRNVEKRLIEIKKMDKIEDERKYRRERNILIRNAQRKRGKNRC